MIKITKIWVLLFLNFLSFGVGFTSVACLERINGPRVWSGGGGWGVDGTTLLETSKAIFWATHLCEPVKVVNFRNFYNFYLNYINKYRAL